jgi:quinol monooxygenase YgiN
MIEQSDTTNPQSKIKNLKLTQRVSPFSRVQEYALLFYQINIEIKKYKTDEFVKSMHSFSRKIRKEKGCLGYSVYRDSDKDNTYILVGEWKTHQAMEKHFKTQNFEVLIGAARVLGDTFEMNIAEVLELGDFKLAREQIASQQRGSAQSD